MPKKEDNVQKSKSHNWILVLAVLIIAVVFVVAISNNFSSGTGSAVSSRQRSLPDLTPVVFDAELISYGEYQSRDIVAYLSIANIGTAKASKPMPIVRVRWDFSDDGSYRGSMWGDYELGPIPPNGGMKTVQSFAGINNLPFKNAAHYLSATADPNLKITESNEENNFLGGYLILNCTSASPDPVSGFDCCLTFEGVAWKRSGTVCY